MASNLSALACRTWIEAETPAGRFELACSSIKERAVSAMIRREKASCIAPAGLI
jgi:hypothetical protein